MGILHRTFLVLIPLTDSQSSLYNAKLAIIQHSFNALIVKTLFNQFNKVKYIEIWYNYKGKVMMSRYDCVTTYNARRSGITNMYLFHKFTIVQMMHVSGHKPPKTFIDYIKLSSNVIADEIDAIINGAKEEVF